MAKTWRAVIECARNAPKCAKKSKILLLLEVLQVNSQQTFLLQEFLYSGVFRKRRCWSYRNAAAGAQSALSANPYFARPLCLSAGNNEPSTRRDFPNVGLQ